MRLIEARYEQGMLKPAEPLALRSGESVHLIVVRRADPDRWDMRRLAETGNAEEAALAEQGIEDWLEKLDEEDQRRNGARSGGPTSVLTVSAGRPVAAR